MRFKYLNGVLLSMYLLSLLWILGSTGVVAQSDLAPSPSQQQVQTGGEREMAPPSPGAPVEQSQFKAWFHRTGSGLFISLTPFATAVVLALLLLIILVPIVIGASQKRSRGYFKTIPHGRQEALK